MKPVSPFSARRPSKLGEKLAQQKVDAARRLSPAQRIQLALHLSDAASRVFSEALIHSVQQLEDAKHRGLLLDFALIGGFAVAAWGAPRATHDVDFAVAIGSADPHATAASLGGTYEAGDPDDPLLGVIHLSFEDRLDAEGILKAQQPQDAELNQLRALALSAGLLEEWESLLRRSFPR